MRKGKGYKESTKDEWKWERESISVTVKGGRYAETIGTMVGQVLLGLALRLLISLHILLLLSFTCSLFSFASSISSTFLNFVFSFPPHPFFFFFFETKSETNRIPFCFLQVIEDNGIPWKLKQEQMLTEFVPKTLKKEAEVEPGYLYQA